MGKRVQLELGKSFGDACYRSMLRSYDSGKPGGDRWGSGGALPWVIDDADGAPIAAFRTRAMRRLVARYLRVVALGVLPGAGKGLGGAVATMVLGREWHVNSCWQLVAGKEK